MNSHLQSIIEKCHLANPKLLEPTFGCEVKYRDYNNRLQVIENTRDGVWVREADKDNWFEKIEKIADFEILGHPITLQDILLAMGKNWAIDTKGQIIDITPTGWFHALHPGSHRAVVYDLTKSPYDQEESVLEFISKNI